MSSNKRGTSGASDKAKREWDPINVTGCPISSSLRDLLDKGTVHSVLSLASANSSQTIVVHPIIGRENGKPVTAPNGLLAVNTLSQYQYLRSQSKKVTLEESKDTDRGARIEKAKALYQILPAALQESIFNPDEGEDNEDILDALIVSEEDLLPFAKKDADLKKIRDRMKKDFSAKLKPSAVLLESIQKFVKALETTKPEDDQAAIFKTIGPILRKSDESLRESMANCFAGANQYRFAETSRQYYKDHADYLRAVETWRKFLHHKYPALADKTPEEVEEADATIKCKAVFPRLPVVLLSPEGIKKIDSAREDAVLAASLRIKLDKVDRTQAFQATKLSNGEEQIPISRTQANILSSANAVVSGITGRTGGPSAVIDLDNEGGEHQEVPAEMEEKKEDKF
jgi:hypothetical protein